MQTDGVIAPDQLRRWAGVKPGDNLIALDLAAVKRNLELVPMIDSVSVERVLPRTLKIRVTEREPVAQVNVPRADGAGGIAVSVFQLDADGLVMQPLDPRLCVDAAGADERATAGDHGLERVSIAAGPVASNRRRCSAALQLIAAFDHSPMAGLVDLRRVDVSVAGRGRGDDGAGQRNHFRSGQFGPAIARAGAKIYDFGTAHEQGASPRWIWRWPTMFPSAGWTPAPCRPSTPKPVNPATHRRKNV